MRNPKLARSFFIEPFRLIDLQKIEDNELREKLWAGLMEIVMKRIYEKKVLPIIQQIAPNIEKIAIEDLAYINSTLWYIIGAVDDDNKDEVIEEFKSVLGEKGKEVIMTIEQRLIEKGKLEGIQESMLKVATNMKAMGHDIKVISKATGLPEDELKKLTQNDIN